MRRIEMIIDSLFEAAFAYKKTRLWNEMWDDEIFAVKFSDGETGYCSVMGAAKDLIALGIYIGAEGFQSYRKLSMAMTMESELKFREYTMCQDCLQLAFENKSELIKEEIEEVRRYTRKHGIRLSGKASYPQFLKYRPYYIPWPIEDEKEQERLREAAEAAIELSRLLKLHTKEEIGFSHFEDDPKTVPMLERRGKEYILKSADLPPVVTETYPTPQMVDDFTAAKIKKMRKSGSWECEVTRMPRPAQENEGDVPYFPATVLAADFDTQFIVPVYSTFHYDENPDELLAFFAEAIITYDSCPATVSVRDVRTYALLQEFCESMGIDIRIDACLPALDDAELSFLDNFSMQEPEDIANAFFEALDQMGEVEEELPDILVKQLLELAEQEPGILPDKLARKLGLEPHEK